MHKIGSAPCAKIDQKYQESLKDVQFLRQQLHKQRSDCTGKVMNLEAQLRLHHDAVAQLTSENLDLRGDLREYRGCSTAAPRTSQMLRECREKLHQYEVKFGKDLGCNDPQDPKCRGRTLNDLESARQDLEHAKELNEQMYQKYEECGRDLAVAQDDIKKLQEKVEGPRGHVQMDLDKIAELEEARHKLSKKFYNLKLELDKKNELLKNREDWIKMLKHKLDEVEANAKGKGEGKGKEGEKPAASKGVNREVQRLKNQITEHKKTIEDLEKRLQQCRKENNWTEQTTRLQQELEDVRKKYKETSEKMNDTEKAALDCGSDLEECVEARTEERMRANRAESEAREARKEVKKAKEALERWVAEQEKRTEQASGAGSRSGAGNGAGSVAGPS